MFSLTAYDPETGEYFGSCLDISDIYAARTACHKWITGLPSGITVDSHGNLLVSDTLNHRIQKISRRGEHISSFGTFGSLDGEFNSPWGICLDEKGNLFVADHLNNRVH